MKTFEEAYALPIGEHVDQKGKFSYLSWVYAVKHLRVNFPGATWRINTTSDGCPVFKMPAGYMVNVVVITEGQSFEQWHPILNHKNKTIESPNAFEINTSIQRCIVKAIGVATGIGLALYAGEDLPVPVIGADNYTGTEEEKKEDIQQKISSLGGVVELNGWLTTNWETVCRELSEENVAEIKEFFLSKRGELQNAADK